MSCALSLLSVWTWTFPRDSGYLLVFPGAFLSVPSKSSQVQHMNFDRILSPSSSSNNNNDGYCRQFRSNGALGCGRIADDTEDLVFLG